MAKYFSEDEMVCKCCGEGADLINPVLLEKLDALREKWGAPIWVSCMYRCYFHNLEVGSFPGSQHELGNAADIYVDGDWYDFRDCVLESELFTGVGEYPPGEGEFIHVDVRPAPYSNYYRW